MSRVAVVAVHGVGGPPEFETARSVAELLSRHGADHAEPGHSVEYSTFTERFLTLPTAPLDAPTPAGAQPPEPAQSFGERLLGFAPGERDRTTFAPDDPDAQTDLDVAFMRDQLAGYETASTRPVYSTIEIVGARDETGPDGQVRHDDVHVFEMYWADLSRVGSGAWRLFGAIYQLILHVAHLGRKTIDLAASDAMMRPKSPNDEARWSALAGAQAWVVRLFTIAVPASTLLLLACVLAFVPDAVPQQHRLIVASIIDYCIAVAAVGLLTYFRGSSDRGATRFVIGMLVLAVAVIALNVLLGSDSALGSVVLELSAAIVLIVVYVATVNAYDHTAPGALSWGVGTAIVALAGTAYFGPRFLRHVTLDPPAQTLRILAFACFQFSYLLLIAAWLCVWGAALLVAFRALRLRRELRRLVVLPRETRARGLRALWTAKVTMAAALFSFILASLVVYEATVGVAWTARNRVNVFPSIAVHSRLPLVSRSIVPMRSRCPAPAAGTAYDPAACAKRFFELMIAQSATVGLPVAIAASALALVMLSAFIVLVVVTSVHEPQTPDRYAVRLGKWMSEGFRWVRWAGAVFVIGLGLALSIGLFVGGWIAVMHAPPPLTNWLSLNNPLLVIRWLAGVAVASATFAAARLRLDALAAGARPALGIILDVDNYLRESPKTSTPRAMIAERFSSLIRELESRRDPGGRPYFSRIVIVSHSQGTVISADLLRFMALTGVTSPDLTNVDLRLITMGSPLRQLYSVNFPHLYDWVDRTDGLDGEAPDDDTAYVARGIVARPLVSSGPGAHPSLNQRSPSPIGLRVSMWVNLYMSGDYVGRALWRPDTTPGVWAYEKYENAAVGDRRRERCLGDGTHTRYWITPEVAREIDAQISPAVAALPPDSFGGAWPGQPVIAAGR